MAVLAISVNVTSVGGSPRAARQFRIAQCHPQGLSCKRYRHCCRRAARPARPCRTSDAAHPPPSARAGAWIAVGGIQCTVKNEFRDSAIKACHRLCAGTLRNARQPQQRCAGARRREFGRIVNANGSDSRSRWSAVASGLAGTSAPANSKSRSFAVRDMGFVSGIYSTLPTSRAPARVQAPPIADARVSATQRCPFDWPAAASRPNAREQHGASCRGHLQSRPEQQLITPRRSIPTR